VTTAIVFKHFLGKPDGVSWLAAAFMFVGYITHLTLDEIYSVDVMDTRLKASFGTALKLFDRRHVYASVGMACATAAAIMLSPHTNTFVEGLSSHNMWTGLQRRLLPTDKWFGIVETPHFAARKPDSGSGVMTGSIPSPLKDGQTTPEETRSLPPATAVQAAPQGAAAPLSSSATTLGPTRAPSGSASP
jgi:hypothetical protein